MVARARVANCALSMRPLQITRARHARHLASCFNHTHLFVLFRGTKNIMSNTRTIICSTCVYMRQLLRRFSAQPSSATGIAAWSLAHYLFTRSYMYIVSMVEFTHTATVLLSGLAGDWRSCLSAWVVTFSVKLRKEVRPCCRVSFPPW